MGMIAQGMAAQRSAGCRVSAASVGLPDWSLRWAQVHVGDGVGRQHQAVEVSAWRVPAESQRPAQHHQLHGGAAADSRHPLSIAAVHQSLPSRMPHYGHSLRVQVNRDGVLASGGDNGSMYLWDWKTGYKFQALQTQAIAAAAAAVWSCHAAPLIAERGVRVCVRGRVGACDCVRV